MAAAWRSCLTDDKDSVVFLHGLRVLQSQARTFFPTEQRQLLYKAAGRTLGGTQETVSNMGAPSPSPAKWMFTVGGANKILCRFEVIPC